MEDAIRIDPGFPSVYFLCLASLSRIVYKGGDIFRFFLLFYCRYSALLHLPPFKFYCVGGCWERTQDCCDFRVRRSNHSATSHPVLCYLFPQCKIKDDGGMGRGFPSVYILFLKSYRRLFLLCKIMEDAVRTGPGFPSMYVFFLEKLSTIVSSVGMGPGFPSVYCTSSAWQSYRPLFSVSLV